MKLNATSYIIFLSMLLTNIITYTMDTTFAGPSTSIVTPRFATKYLTTFNGNISYSKADTSYDCSGQKTELLSYYGAEDLLKRFIDPTLPYTNTSSIGKALISGNFTTISYSGSYIQNIGENIFIEASTSFTNAQLRKFRIHPLHANGKPLSQAEINADPTVKDYLTKINDLIFVNDKNSLHYSSVGPSFLTCGYTKHFQDFTYIDFIDVAIRTGFVFPINDVTPNSTSFLTLPTNDFVCIGVPINLSALVGLYDWLNIGANGICMPFISNEHKVHLNTTATNNLLFLPSEGYCLVHHKPFLYFDAYVEAEHFFPKLSFLGALSFAKQFKTTYKSLDQEKFPDIIINKYPLHKPWQVLYLTLSIDFDFANEYRKNLPHIKMVYVTPLCGKSIFKTYALSGQLFIEFLYEF